MKKIFSGILLSVLMLSQMQVLQVYAQDQAQLQSEKNTGIEILDAVEQVIDTAVEKLDDKIKDTTQLEQLQEKHEEIEEYLQEVEQKIENENSAEDIQELVEKAKKVVVLKVVSGVTEYENIEENISEDVASTSTEIEEAMESIQDSLIGENNDYSLIVKTQYSKKKVRQLLERFDDDSVVELMYTLGKNKYFEILLKKDSLFRQEMMEDIESGILPDSFIGMDLVLPEVFIIEGVKSAEKVQKNLLKGEDLSQTWGIEQYQTYRYFSEIKKTSKKIKVGVVDTGIDYNHPDLQKRVLVKKGRDFVNKDTDAMDDQGHGTHVAGTIAASVNKSGIIGVNPYTKLIPLKICSENGFCPTYAVIKALTYASKKEIDILNMSLGGRGNPIDHPICDAISAYTQAGGIAVVAAGNSNIDTSSFVPGGCTDAITVAGIDNNQIRAVFSNYGGKVDVSAPGTQIYSTALGGGYKKLSGTSMSTPHITGIVSLMLSYNPDITTTEIKELFRDSQSPVQSEASKPIAGGVDFDSLIYNIKNPDTPEIVEPEITLKEEEEEDTLEENDETIGGNEEIISEAIIVEREIEFIENQEALDQVVIQRNIEREEELHNYTLLDTPANPDPVFINVFSQDEDIIINSESFEQGETETGTIIITQVEQMFDINQSGDKGYNQNGVEVSNIEIHSLEEESTIPGLQISDDFDIYNLPQLDYTNFDPIEINSDEDSEDEPEMQEIFIDGAEKGVEINSIEDEGINLDSLPEYIEISDFDTGTGEYISGGVDTIINPTEVQIQAVGDLEGGLVGSWDLNGDAQDSSGNGNHGTANNVGWEETQGENKVGSFNGGNSKVDLGTSLNIGNNDFSVSVWAKNNNTRSRWRGIFSKYTSSAGGFYLGMSGKTEGKILTAVRNRFSIESQKTGLKDNQWHYYTLVSKNGEYGKLYIDGVLDTEVVSNYGNILGTGISLKIGITQGSEYFGGNIGLAKMYNTALSQTEIDQLYQEGQEKLFFIEEEEVGELDEINALEIKSIISETDYINGDNQDAFELEVQGTYYAQQEEDINYSYSFDGENYIDVPGDIEISSYLEAEYIDDAIYAQDYDEESSTGSLVEETLQDSETRIEERIGIESIEESLAINEFYHDFGNLMDIDVYDGYTGYKANKYSLQNTSRGILSTNSIQAKTVDNYMRLYTKDRFTYTGNPDVTQYYGSFTTHTASKSSGWNQGSQIGVFDANDDWLLHAGIATYQYPSINYHNSRGIDIVCGTNTYYDDTQCLNGGNQTTGDHFILVYKRKDGGHTKISYKLPSNIPSNIKIDFDIDLKAKQILVYFYNTSGDEVYKIDSAFPNAKDFDYTEFEDIRFVAGAGTTNNTNQKISPHSLGLRGEEVEIDGELYDFSKKINIDVSGQQDGYLKLYVKAFIETGSTHESFIHLVKEYHQLTAPTGFTTAITTAYEPVIYTWDDKESSEFIYTLKDENNSIILANTDDFREDNLYPGNTYTRKICASNSLRELCSESITFTIPLPEVITQDVIINLGASARIYLPVVLDNYDISGEGTWVFDTFIKDETSIYISAKIEGIYSVYLKDENGFDRYIVNITSQPQYQDYTLTLGDTIDVWYNSKYEFRGFDSSIVEYDENGNDSKLIGKKEGYTEIFVYKVEGSSQGLRKVWRITVVPQPEIVHVSCEVEVGNRCYLSVNTSGYYYETDLSIGDYDVRASRSQISVESTRSGYFTTYMRAQYGDYITHVFETSFTPKAAKIYTCSIAVGGECDLGKYYTNKTNLDFTETNPGLIDIQYTREASEGYDSEWEDSGDNEYLNFEGGYNYQISYTIIALKLGTGDIYIYDGNEHLATVTIEAIQVPEFTVDDRYIKIDQGETGTINILSGGGEYVEHSDYEDLDYIDVDTDDTPTNHSYTGDIEVRDDEVKTHYPKITDKYNQIKELAILIKDVELQLSAYLPELKVGQFEYLNVLSSYGVPKVYLSAADQEILHAQVVRLGDSIDYDIKLTPKKVGTVNLEVSDGEGTVRVVRLVIGEGEEEEEEVNLDLELNKLLEELFFNLEDGVDVNYTPGCVPVESEECLQEAISEAEAFRQIDFILSYESKVEGAVDKLLNKVGNEAMERINSLLIQKRFQGEYSGDVGIIVDMIIVRIRMKLGGEAYLKGVQDALAINNLFDIAVGLGAGAGASIIVQKLVTKYPEKFATKLGSKAIPVVGWGLTVFMIGYTGVHTAEYVAACFGDEKIEGELPDYYCGKLTVNGILLFAGVGASKVNFPGIFKKMNVYQSGHKNLKYDDVTGQNVSTNTTNSVVLGENLVFKGAIKPTLPDKPEAHHIVMGGAADEHSMAAREILDTYGININEAGNGVFLPATKEFSCSGTCTHRGDGYKVHTLEYREYVLDQFQGVQSKEDMYDTLDKIRNELLTDSLNF